MEEESFGRPMRDQGWRRVVRAVEEIQGESD